MNTKKYSLGRKFKYLFFLDFYQREMFGELGHPGNYSISSAQESWNLNNEQFRFPTDFISLENCVFYKG